jgi:crotonobetainyl-CoA:carnitine CoA-transferase CaiB-like acyl-CoA transferase
MILRLLNPQGIAGIAISLALAILLVVQKIDTRHCKKQSASFEQLYHQDQAAFATTVANYRAATDQARAADQANVQRVAAENQAINERTEHDFEARLAAARAAAERLRVQSEAAADPGARPNPSMSGLPAPAGGAAQIAGKDRLPPPDALTATEQAIQLDELIKWVRAQAAVDPNAQH